MSFEALLDHMCKEHIQEGLRSDYRERAVLSGYLTGRSDTYHGHINDHNLWNKGVHCGGIKHDHHLTTWKIPK